MDKRKRDDRRCILWCINRQTGSLLIDYLLTLSIALTLLPILVVSLFVLSYTLKINPKVQDMIATYQFQRMLLISYDMTILEDSLYFNYQNREMKASVVNQNLIIQPGTQVIYPKIENVSFYKEDGVIYVAFERNAKKYEIALCHE